MGHEERNIRPGDIQALSKCESQTLQKQYTLKHGLELEKVRPVSTSGTVPLTTTRT